MRHFSRIHFFGALSLALAACGSEDAGPSNEAADLLPGQSVNAADGIDAGADASGTTGSTTGDAGGPLNIAGDAANDSQETNSAANAH